MKKTIIITGVGVLAFMAGAVAGRTKYGDKAAQWFATGSAKIREKFGKKDTDGFEDPTEQ